ncbi:hypothetical protein B0J13DRAFT_529705 [Dactylonectria estremocensis]|uniref:Uncharacterized protein n=1 Tax=Dactylonectria estremocensis TaxID=1079267 RepID=A0A9P9E862_9HYPO|nr:hypothetical protein B0J13DRAFT_529705 [Dactylonectria estremocensis]
MYCFLRLQESGVDPVIPRPGTITWPQAHTLMIVSDATTRRAKASTSEAESIWKFGMIGGAFFGQLVRVLGLDTLVDDPLKTLLLHPERTISRSLWKPAARLIPHDKQVRGISDVIRQFRHQRPPAETEPCTRAYKYHITGPVKAHQLIREFEIEGPLTENEACMDQIWDQATGTGVFGLWKRCHQTLGLHPTPEVHESVYCSLPGRVRGFTRLVLGYPLPLADPVTRKYVPVAAWHFTTPQWIVPKAN